MPFVRPHRTYYKYGTEPNVTVVGSPTISNGVVSGFSSGNYLQVPKTVPLATADSFEIFAKFTYLASGYLFAENNAAYFSFLQVDGGNKLSIYCSSNHSSSFIYTSGSTTLTSGNTYYVKYVFTGSAYIVYLSSTGKFDGEESTEINVASTAKMMDFTWNIGCSNRSGYYSPFGGSIDLTQSYIKINGEDWWRGTKIVESNESDYEWYVDSNKLYNLARRKRSYYKYDEESTPINENGVVTSATGGNGWKIYTQANYGEVFLMLNATANTSYPRWQAGSPNVYAYFKTPKKGIISSYLTTQWCDENATGRICNHWIIAGYESEADMLALTNGTVIDDNTWASVSKGTSKTITLDNNKAFQYYTIHMVSNFANGSYCSMGNTKFYMREPIEATSSDYDYYTDKLISHNLAVQDVFTYRIIHKQTATGTYTITLDRDYEGNLLFVGNGGGGGSSQNDSYWRNTSGGSGACFQGRVRLPKGTYTLTIGTLGYGYNIGNTANMTGGVDSTDSYLTDENGNELIRVGCGARGTVIGTGGAGGTLTLGTLEVLETTKAVNGNQGDAWGPVYGQGKQVFATSAYDGTTTGYGAGTSSYYGGSNVYGVAGIFKLDIEYLDKGLRSY